MIEKRIRRIEKRLQRLEEMLEGGDLNRDMAVLSLPEDATVSLVVDRPGETETVAWKHSVPAGARGTVKSVFELEGKR